MSTNPLSPEGATRPLLSGARCAAGERLRQRRDSRRQTHQRGSALLAALVVLMMTTAIGAVVVTLATVGHSTVRNGYYREKAYCIAESGIEKAIVEIGRDPAFTGEPDVPFDIGSFSTTVRTLDDGDVEITSIGQAQRGISMRFKQRIVARIHIEAGRPRIISWTASPLPTERLAQHD